MSRSSSNDRRRRDEGRVGEAQRGRVELGVGGRPGVVHRLGHGELALRAAVVGHRHDAAHALAALVAHEVARERASRPRASRRDGGPRAPASRSRPSRLRRRRHELEVHGVVGVGEDDEAVAVGRARRVGDVVLHALLAGVHHARAAAVGSAAGISSSSLVTFEPEVMCTHCLGEAEPDRHEEALVGVLVRRGRRRSWSCRPRGATPGGAARPRRGARRSTVVSPAHAVP